MSESDEEKMWLEWKEITKDRWFLDIDESNAVWNALVKKYESEP